MICNKIRNQFDSKGRDCRKQNVGGCACKACDVSLAFAMVERSPDTENPDSADGDGHKEPEENSFNEIDEDHRLPIFMRVLRYVKQDGNQSPGLTGNDSGKRANHLTILKIDTKETIIAKKATKSPSRSKDAGEESFCRSAIIKILTAESRNESILFNMNSVEKGRTYRDKHNKYTEIVGKEQSKSEEGKQTAGIGGMSDETVNTFPDYAMIFRDCHVNSELAFQRENRRPSNNKSANDKSDADRWKQYGSISKVSGTLHTEQDAGIDADQNGYPQNAQREFIDAPVGFLSSSQAGQDNFRS